MFLDRVFIERSLIADMHVRIDQSRNQKSALTVDLLRVRAGDEISPDFRDASIADDHRGVSKRSCSFRRN